MDTSLHKVSRCGGKRHTEHGASNQRLALDYDIVSIAAGLETARPPPKGPSRTATAICDAAARRALCSRTPPLIASFSRVTLRVTESSAYGSNCAVISEDSQEEIALMPGSSITIATLFAAHR